MAESPDHLTTREIHCPKCGYNLFGLTEFRCPECGSPFDPKDVAVRTHLLPWERPEIGGRIRRLSRTIILASLHPGRYFSAISQRKDRPVENAGSLVAACIIAAICIEVTVDFLVNIILVFRIVPNCGALQALDFAFEALLSNDSLDWYMLSIFILPKLLSVCLISAFLARVFRKRFGALRTMDLAAVFSPAIVFEAIIAAVNQVVLALNFGSMGIFVVMLYSQWLVLLLLVWYCCRKLLALNRAKTVAMVILCGILKYGSEMLAGFVLTPFLVYFL